MDIERPAVRVVEHGGVPVKIEVVRSVRRHRTVAARPVGGVLRISIPAAILLLYIAWITARARRVTGYKPVLEDWIWHTLLPAVAYAVLMAAAVVLTRVPIVALFAIGSSAALLLFIGIHNAWDTVVFLALSRTEKQKPE